MGTDSGKNISVKAAIPYVALGGAIGAGLRYLMLELSPFSDDYSYLVIMAENVAGAFLLGLLAGLIARTKVKSWPWAPFLGTGILGSFTTFSTFVADILYLGSTSLAVASLYIAGSVVAGLFTAILGFSLGSAQKTRGGFQ